MKYTKGYKYQLAEDYTFSCDLDGYLKENWFSKFADIKFISYNSTMGDITIYEGYAWDGPSGPTKDDKTNMRASLEHDVLYQLMRCEVLFQNFRKIADYQFDKTARLDGMLWFRRKYYVFLLRKAAGFAAKPRNKKKVYTVGSEK